MSGHTPGPWKAGVWSGRCKNPEHIRARNHTGPPECVYEDEFNPMTDEDGYVCFTGISTNDPNRSVVEQHYDDLSISMADAALIVKAPELFEMVGELLRIVKARGVEKADQEIVLKAEELLR